MPRPVRRHLLALTIFALAALVLTWPLTLHLTTHVPGDGIDNPALAWNLWWIKARLVDQTNLNFFDVGWMFHPIDVNLAFYTLTPLNGLLSVPLQTALQLTLASNLILLSSFVLGAYGMFLLALYLLAKPPAVARSVPSKVQKPALSAPGNHSTGETHTSSVTASGRAHAAYAATDLPGEHGVASGALDAQTPNFIQGNLAAPHGPSASHVPRWHSIHEREYVLTLIALAAGFFYAYASTKLFYVALGQFNIASSQWIPFAVLYVLRLSESRTSRAALRNGALAGLFLVLQAWAELTYASFLLIFFALVALWWGIMRVSGVPSKTSWSAASWQAFGAGVLASAAVFVAGLSPFLAAMVPDLRAEGDFFASGGGFADIFSADLMGYLAPTMLHPLIGTLTGTLPFPHDKGQHIYLGYVLVLLAAFGVYAYGVRKHPWSHNVVWFWATSTLVFWLLTLGPALRWAGHELPVPGPFAVVSRIPFFSGNRYPSRYGVMLLLSVAALALYGLRTVTSMASSFARGIADGHASAEESVSPRTSRTPTVIVFAVIALFLFEHLSIPLPLTDFRVPSLYDFLRADSEDVVVLELPTGWRNGARVLGRSDVLIMMQQWYQTHHGKRRLGGNTSRNPPLKFQYFTEAPLLGDLIALMNADRSHIGAVVDADYENIAARMAVEAPYVLDFLDVAYVVLHVERSPHALIRVVEDSLPVDLISTWNGPDWTGTESTIRLYAVTEHTQDAEWNVDLAQPSGRLYMAEGWSTLDTDGSDFRFATRPDSTLLLDLPSQGGELQLALAGIADFVELRLNDHPLLVSAANESGVVNATVPADIADQPIDRLSIFWKGDPMPISVLATQSAGNRSVGDTATALAGGATIGVRSAGEEVGDFARIYVNGVDVAPNQRGYNLVALEPDGEVLDAQAFDTHASAAASDALAAWVHQWPAGTIIAGAVADEASNRLQQTAVDALATLGVAEDLTSKFRWSHAFIGAAGAVPGSAREEAGLLRPADVSIGPPLDAPSTTGGIGSVSFRPSE